jgi:hypothetical protein
MDAVQYIKDNNGQIAYAIVPIDIWENTISQAHEPVVKYGNIEEKPFDVRDYFGIITIDMTDEELAHELNELRSEWDRDF